MIYIQVPPIGSQALSHLIGKFASRGQHKNTRSPGSNILRIFVEDVQDWQRECRSFPCPSLGTPEQVSSLEQGRNSLGLDRREGPVIALTQSALDRRGKWQRLKRGWIHFSLGTGAASVMAPEQVPIEGVLMGTQNLSLIDKRLE